MNGAVAKITCPRAAPSCCAPRTHSVIDAPYPNTPTSSAPTTDQPLTWPGAGDHQAEGEVDAARDDALEERDVLRADLVDPRRDAVVESPTGARSDDQQRTKADRRARLPDQQHPGAGDEQRGRDHVAAEVLAEQRRGEHDGGDQLHVEQQRRRRRWGVDESCREQRRTDRAAGDDRHAPTVASRAAAHDGRATGDPPRRHRHRRAEVQQPGQNERLHVLAMTDAAGVDAPNSTAAKAQFRTPDRVTTSTVPTPPRIADRWGLSGV